MTKTTKKKRDRSQTAKPRARELSVAAAGPSFWLVTLLFCFPILLVYVPGFDVPFLYDDDDAIVENESIHSVWPLIGTTERPGPLKPPREMPTAGRPLVNLSFALNYHFSGTRPFAYHATNAAIHVINATLLWALLWRTLRLPYFCGRFNGVERWLSFAVTIIWSLHPLQTEAVIYATQRTELLMALFYLATIYCSLRYWVAEPSDLRADGPGQTPLLKGGHARRGLWLTLAVLSCFAGMASKEVMVSAPLVVLLYERTFIAGSLRRALRHSWPLYVGLSATWLLLIALIRENVRPGTAGFSLGISVYSYWLTQTKVMLMYLKLAVWPRPLLLHYQLPYLNSLTEAWMYVLPVLLIGSLLLLLLWRNHPVGFLGAWFGAILSPTLIVPIVTEMAAERRMYLPLAMLLVIFVIGGYLLLQRIPTGGSEILKIRPIIRRPMAALICVTCLVAFVAGLASARRVQAYYQPLGLWRQVLEYQPANHTAHENVGYYLSQNQQIAAAIEEFRKAIEVDPRSVQARYNLATLLLNTGKVDEAVELLRQAVAFVPRDYKMRSNLATSLMLARRYDEALAEFQATLELNPNNATILKNMGIAQRRAGKFSHSIATFEKALRVNPQAADLYLDLAISYDDSGDRENAIAKLEEGLKKARTVGNSQLVSRIEAKLDQLTKPARR